MPLRQGAKFEAAKLARSEPRKVTTCALSRGLQRMVGCESRPKAWIAAALRCDAGNLLAVSASMLNLTVQKFMTSLPYTISHEQSLEDAHQLMRKHDIRHLPVLKDGRLAGVVSQRDLYMIGTLEDIDLKEVPVADAMSTDIYAVGPRTSIRKITEEMVTHRYGSAIVMDGDEVLGIFTATDALRALNGVLTALIHMPERSISR